MNSGLLTLILAINFLWLIIISFFVWKTISSLRSVFKGDKNKNIIETLRMLMKVQDDEKEVIARILDRLKTLENKSLSHIQKIGLRRFNPFSDTGGEQSFILALLDKTDSGVVISGLYARSGMRWYIKQVAEGKGVDHDLSDEEKKAIESAK